MSNLARETRVSQERCRRCRNPALPGFTRCAECRARNNRDSSAAHCRIRRERRDAGLCTTGGCDRPLAPGRVRCAQCTTDAEVNQARKVRRQALMAEGRCCDCGKPSPTGSSYCGPCREDRRAKYLANRPEPVQRPPRLLDRLREHLRAEPGPHEAPALAAVLGARVETVRVYLSKLRRLGELVRMGHGRYEVPYDDDDGKGP